jgi:CheY-like chemotaxis protein
VTGEFLKKSGRVLVIEEARAFRQQLAEVLRTLGFTDITVASSGDEGLSLLEQEPIDWLITSVMGAQRINGLTLLRVIAEDQESRHIASSLLYDESEAKLLPLAFQLGLLSCHPRGGSVEDATRELRGLLDRVRSRPSHPALVAVDYLRPHLIKARSFAELVQLDAELAQRHPGSIPLLLKVLVCYLF